MIKMKKKHIIISAIIIILVIIVFSSFGNLSKVNESTLSEMKDVNVIIISEKDNQNAQVQNVKTNNKEVNLILSECGLDKHCTVEKMQNLSETKSEEELLEIISLTMKTYDILGIWCHQQGHHIGEFLLEYYNGDFHLALANANHKCDSSLFHGIIETFLKKQIILDDVLPEDIQVKNSCDFFEDRLTKLECAHGMGHGLVGASDFDLQWSANRCNEFDLLELQQACYRGVFMENVVAIMDARGGIYDNDDPFYPCNTLEERYAQVCYQYQTPLMAHRASTNVFDTCDKIEPKSLIKYCYIGVKPLFGSRNDSNFKNVIIECKKGNPDYQTYCFIGYLVGLSDWKGIQQGIEFCKVIPEEFKTDCYDYLGKAIHDEYYEHPNRIEEECSKIESIDYEEICKKSDPKDLRILIV